MPISPKPYLREVDVKPSENTDTYPHNIPAVRALNGIKFHADVTFFVGENGSGKSTVLEAIAMALGYGAEGGTLNMQIDTTSEAGSESASTLHQSLHLIRGYQRPRDGFFLRAETFFNVATKVDDTGYLGGYSNKSLHARSHGEAFMTLLTTKFQGDGLYLLDEPEAALSPTRQMAALAAIHRLVEENSQLIIATHSPILLAYPNAKILQFDADGIHEIAYEDTEHFVVTRDFLNHYPRRVAQLLADED
jgi:predicted ATPase